MPKLEEIIQKLDRLETTSSEPAQPAATTPNQGQVNVDKVEKQLSKLHRTIFIATILICIPIFFLFFGSFLSKSDVPVRGTNETTQTNHLQQEETAGTVTEPTIEESTPPSNPGNQSENAYAIDTIAYTSEDFRSLIVTNDGIVYYIDGSTISNSSDDISLDMQTDFDVPLENGYLAYDPYNDIVYLLAGGSLSIYDISDLSNPRLVIDESIYPDIAQIVLEYSSEATFQIAILPDGSLLVPADLDGTYRIDLTSKHISSFNRIYSLQSPYYALLIEDNIMTLREGSIGVTVVPLYGGQEYAGQLEYDAPYKNTICSVRDHLLFYDDGVGICQINVDGTFSVFIAEENIKVKDYHSLNCNNIGSIAANQNGVIAFYDNTLKCIRCISKE